MLHVLFKPKYQTIPNSPPHIRKKKEKNYSMMISLVAMTIPIAMTISIVALTILIK
jgi:hypothetical protein